MNDLEKRWHFSDVVDRAKKEILLDMAWGNVPTSVGSFSELHDHVDANEYGGACEAWYEGCTEVDEFCDFWNRVQNEVDAWLRAGGPLADLARYWGLVPREIRDRVLDVVREERDAPQV